MCQIDVAYKVPKVKMAIYNGKKCKRQASSIFLRKTYDTIQLPFSVRAFYPMKSPAFIP